MGLPVSSRISGPPVETALSYLVFSPDKRNAALARDFDKAILEMERDGTLNRVLFALRSPAEQALAGMHAHPGIRLADQRVATAK